MSEEQQTPAPVAPIASDTTTDQNTDNANTAPLRGADWEAHKNNAMIARVPFLFWLPFTNESKSSPFAMFHANQGLLLLVIWVLGESAYMLVPFLFPLMWIIQLGVLVFTIMGIIEASKGEMKPLPFIGHITLIK